MQPSHPDCIIPQAERDGLPQFKLCAIVFKDPLGLVLFFDLNDS